MSKARWMLCLVAIPLLSSCGGSPTNSNRVVLTPGAAQTIAQGKAVEIAAAVSNDTSNAGVRWSLSPAASTGSLQSTTATTTTYEAPNSVTSPITATVTATSISFATQTASLKITVEPPPTITTTSLPSGSVNASYSATVDASGGVAPFTWSVESGSLPSGLSLGSTTTNSAPITGTPTVSGDFTFTVKLTDSAGESAISPSLVITVASANANDALLNGNYAFQLSGFNSAGSVVLAGSFTADGKGSITSGVEDFNSIQGPPKNQTFSGSYALGGDNRGMFAFTSLADSPTFAFAVDVTGSHGRFIEFDSTGIRGSGEIEKQSVSACQSNTISGQYVVGFAGSQAGFSNISIAGPVAVAGTFTASPPGGNGQGSLGPGEADANTPGFINVGALTVSGTYQTTPQSARCAISLAVESLPTLTMSAYPVSSSELLLVETSAVTSTTPILISGKMRQQSPVQGPSELNGTSVGGLIGQNSNGSTFVPDVAIAAISATGGGDLTLSLVDNQAGNVQTFGSPINATYTIDASGRVGTDLGNPLSPILYMIGQNDFVMIGTIQGNPRLGFFEPQSGSPFNSSTFKGGFLEGTLTPATDSVPELSGTLSLDGVSKISGTEDQSAPSGNSSGQAVMGSYAITNSTLGGGTVTFTEPANLTGDFFVISPTKLVLVTTTQGDSNPVIIVLGN